MNQILAGIYGTQGHEKVAAANGQTFSTLSDLADALTAEVADGGDLQKVASVQTGILEELEFYDLSGRAAAHAEFSLMEKAASEGDTSALEAFFADADPQMDVKQAILEELSRRA